MSLLMVDSQGERSEYMNYICNEMNVVNVSTKWSECVNEEPNLVAPRKYCVPVLAS